MTDEPKHQDEQQPETIPKEQYLRLAADLENYRRRMESELSDMAKFGATRVVESMVDVMDLLNAAIQHAPPEVQQQAEWFKGLENIDKQFIETMKKFGVQRIEAVGKPFDPTAMEAISMVEGGESQVVQSEVRAGYKMHDRVIRPSRVIIYT